MTPGDTAVRRAIEKVEAARKRRGISVREASGRVHNISEGYWRQFVAGGVKQSGVWVPKTPTPEQVVRMATAVGIGPEIADDLGLESPEPPGMDELDAIEELLQSALAELNRLKREREKPA